MDKFYNFFRGLLIPIAILFLLPTAMWGADITATLTGSAMLEGSNPSTSYADHTTGITDDQNNTYTGRWVYQKSGSYMNMIQLKKRESSNSPRIAFPTFPGNIKSIKLTVSSTSATSSSGGGCTASFNLGSNYDSGNYSTGSIWSQAKSTTGISSVSIDLSGKSTNGSGLYLTIGDSGARIWSIVVVYAGSDTPSTFSVTYNANGATSGSVPTDDTKYDKDASVTVLGNTGSLVKTGYTFAGWKDANGNEYVAGSSFTITTNTILSANWTANTYEVTFDKNNEAATGSMEKQSIRFDQSANLTANAFELAHNTFSGWATTPSGSKSYNDQASYKMTTEGATLYAVWTKNKTTITLDKQNGTGGTSSVTATYGEAMPTLSTTPTKTGYDFAGYYSATDKGGTKYYNADKSSAINWDSDEKTATLYAGWDPKVVTITLNANDHGVANGSVNMTYNSSELSNVTWVEPKTGYELDGYYTTATGGSKVINADGTIGDNLNNWISSGKYVKTSNGTLYAHYTPINYDITWMANGEAWSGKGGSTTAAHDAKVAAVPTTNPAYDYSPKVFLGWTKSENYENAETAPSDLFTTVAESPVIDGPTTFYAVFANLDGTTATFDASTAEASDDLTWTSNGITLKLSAGQLYQTRDPYTFTVTGGTSNYFRISSETYALTKIITEISESQYKINTVTDGTLSISGTIQTVDRFSTGTKSVDCKASSSQIRAKKITVLAGVYSNYATTVEAKTMHHLSVGGRYKALYKVGELFDDANMTVMVCYDEAETDYRVVSNYNVDKSTKLTTENATWRISYTEAGNTINKDIDIDVVALDHITLVAGDELKTAYCEGEDFVSTGLTASATWGTEENKTITEDITYTITDGDNLAYGKTFVTASYTHEGTTKTAQQTISVRKVVINDPVFAEGNYTIKVDDADAVTADGGDPVVAKKGQKIVLASTPNKGYKPASTPFEVKDEDDASVSVSTAGGQYSFVMPGKDVTITAKFSAVYTITAAECTHGSITAIKDNSGNPIAETSYRSTVKIEVSNDEHYHLSDLYYIKDNDDTQTHVAINESEGVYSFSMPQSDVTVYAEFEADAQYTITLMDKGAQYGEKITVYEGDNIKNAIAGVTAPSNDDLNYEGYTFAGWVTSQDTETPAYLSSTATVDDEDIVLYAMYKKGDGDLYRKITSAPSDWSGTYLIVFADSKPHSEIKVNSESKDDFIAATNAPSLTITGGVITATTTIDEYAVTVAKGSTSGSYTIQIPNGEFLYHPNANGMCSKEDATDLYLGYYSGNNQTGVQICNGSDLTNTKNRILYQNSSSYRSYTDKINNSSYKLPDFYKKEYGEMEYSLEISAVYSEAKSLSLVAYDSNNNYYATFSSDKVTFWPEMDNDVEFATYVQTVDVSDNMMEMDTLSTANGIEGLTGYFVPANTGVLVKVEFVGKAENTVPYYEVSNKDVAALENNLLMPGTGSKTTANVDSKFYRLAYANYNAKTGLGFYYGQNCQNGEAFTCKVGSAYLAVPTTVAGAPTHFVFGDWANNPITTGVEAVNKCVDTKKMLVRGQLVIVRGSKLYDMNGRLVK